MKLHLNESTVEQLRDGALNKGVAEEQFNKWLEDCVVVVKPFDGYA